MFRLSRINKWKQAPEESRSVQFLKRPSKSFERVSFKLTSIGLAGLLLFCLVILFACSDSGEDEVRSDFLTPQVIRPAFASLPRQSLRLGDAPGDETLEILISLKQNVAPEDQERAIVQATRADAPERFKAVSMNEIAQKYGANKEAEGIATEYFQSLGKSFIIDPTRTFGHALLTVEEASAIFGVHFDQYADNREVCMSEDRSPYINCTFIAPREGETVSVPRKLLSALPEKEKPDRFVSGLSTRHVYLRKKSKKPVVVNGIENRADPQSVPYWALSGEPEGCTDALGISPATFTPSQIRQAYHFPEHHLQSGMSIALMQLNCPLRKEDVNGFSECYNLPMPTVISSDVSSASLCEEAALDVSTVMVMAPGVDTIYMVSGNGTHSDFAKTLALVVSQTDANGDPVHVVSISYDTCEQEVVKDWNASISDLETVLRKAAAAHVTVVVSAGDQGSSACSEYGMDNNASPAVNYPASSAWVTSVGGTNLYLEYSEKEKRNVIEHTEVWNDSYLYSDGCQVSPGTAGGGGISGTNAGTFTGIRRPNWQVGKGVISHEKRQIPDIAFYADMYPGVAFLFLDQWQPGGGTSFAAPLFASAVLYYNAEHPGRKMGFANPVLYKAIREKKIKVIDITEGSNQILVTDEQGKNVLAPGNCCKAGPEYDRASGWGSVMIDSMLRYSEVGDAVK